MSKYQFGSIVDRDFRLELQRMADYISRMGYTYEESLQKAQDILEEAKQTNDMNESVQQQINTLILENGTSDAEVVQARIDSEGNEYDVLKTRLDKKDHDFKLSELYATQFDFVRYVEDNITNFDNIILKKENSAGWFHIICVKGDKHITHQFRPGLDGYVILADLFTGGVTHYDSFYQAVNATNLQGDINTSSYPNYYATTIGDSFEAEIKGEEIEFKFRADDRGGLWLLTLNGGEQQERISTYSASTITLKQQIVFRNLEDKTHHVKAEFLGIDPNHQYDVSPRGWFYSNDTALQNKTFVSRITRVENSKDFVVAGTSNREFAIEMRPEGVGDYQFVPKHSGTPGVDMIKPAQIMLDGASVDVMAMSNDEQIKNIKDFKLIQNAYAKNDVTENNLAEITTVTSIDKKGKVYITGKMKTLNPIEISDGYGLMINANHDFADRFVSGIDNEYETTVSDGSRTNLVEENDRVASGAFLSDEKPNLILGFRFDDLKRSLRQGEEGKYSPENMYWIHHRNEFQKLYNSSFRNATLEPGESYKWKGVYILAEIPNVNDLF